MNKVIWLAFIFLTACSAPKHNTGNITITANDMIPYGRTITENNRLELISSAAHVGFSFQGTEVAITASLDQWQDHNYLQYELDGVYQKRIKISRSKKQSVIIAIPTEGKHTIWLYKATEATTGPIYLESISGKGLKTLSPAKAPLIEFVGNSITCGAAADPSEVPCGQGEYLDQHNAYMAYGPRVARALGTNFILSSVSGIGIYRTWNSDHPSMPLVFEKSDFREDSKRYWDFNKYDPKVVSIALGTNDLSDGDGKTKRLPFDSARFVTGYVQFVQLLHAKYPKAKIALLSSPMMNGAKRILLQNCLAAVKAKADPFLSGKPIALYFFNPMQPRGCSYHPSVNDHAILADELTPFFKKLIND